MTARQPRFEIVRTEAAQPWHARFRAANGAIVWTTEQYARERTAARAIQHLGRADWRRGRLLWLMIYDGDAGRVVEVRTVDEREAKP